MSSRMTELEVKAWVAGLISQAWELVVKGLHPAHEGDITSWAADFFIGDFPWGVADRHKVVEAFVAHPDYSELQRLIEEKYNFDIGVN